MIYAYVHTFAGGVWREPLTECLDAIANDLAESLFTVTFGIVGPHDQRQQVHDVLDELDMGIWPHIYTIESDTGFEQLTLNRMVTDLPAMTDTDTVIYLHGKGAGYPSNVNTAWRRTMLHLNITHWQEMVTALDDHDLAGIWWQNATIHPAPHFQGNFFHGRADYLKTLPLCSTEDRWKAELWAGQNEPRVFDALPGQAGGVRLGDPDWRCPYCA